MLVLCHPEPRSFNHRLAARVQTALAGAGHDIRFHDLYAEGFDPVLTAAELRRGISFDERVQQHAADLEACEGLVIVHPVWWAGPPALLKGWVDRVLRRGVAYEFEGEEFLPKRRKGLLSAKRALVFATSDSTDESDKATLRAFWQGSVFAYSGLERSGIEIFDAARDSLAQSRLVWLDHCAEIAIRWFAEGSQGHGVSEPSPRIS